MGELSTSPIHQIVNNLNMIPSKIVIQVEGTDGHNTSKAKLSLGFRVYSKFRINLEHEQRNRICHPNP